MTGPELRAIRLKLGLVRADFGRALGYNGTRETLSTQVYDYERGRRPIPERVARLIDMYGKHGIPRKYARTLRDDLKPPPRRPPLPDWKPEWEKQYKTK